jgi:hypothetical protein
MEAIILTSEQFERIERSINELKEIIIANKRKNPLSETWLDVQEVCLLLKISKRTLQSYRDNRILPYSQISGKIYFKATDIEAHLIKHYVKTNR